MDGSGGGFPRTSRATSRGEGAITSLARTEIDAPPRSRSYAVFRSMISAWWRGVVQNWDRCSHATMWWWPKCAAYRCGALPPRSAL